MMPDWFGSRAFGAPAFGAPSFGTPSLDIPAIDIPSVDLVAVRRAAAGLRATAATLVDAEDALGRMDDALAAAEWTGAGADAYRASMGAVPLVAACRGGATVLVRAADALDQFAVEAGAALAELVAVQRLAGSLDPALPAVGMLVGLVVERGDRARAGIDDAAGRLAGVFDALDDETLLATPPRTLADVTRDIGARVVHHHREAAFGAVAASIDLVTSLPEMAAIATVLANPLLAGHWVVTNRDDVAAVGGAFADDPDGFSLEVAKAVIDWEALQENPSRWVGSLAPDVVLAVATYGAGPAVTATSRAARAFERADDVVDAMRAVDRVGDAATGALPGALPGAIGAPAVRGDAMLGRAVGGFDRAFPRVGRARRWPGGLKDDIDARYGQALAAWRGPGDRRVRRVGADAAETTLGRRLVLGRLPGYRSLRDLDRLVAGVPALPDSAQAGLVAVHTADFLDSVTAPVRGREAWERLVDAVRTPDPAATAEAVDEG